MKNKVNEESQVKERVEQESLAEKHSEPYEPERHFIIFAALSRFSAYYRNITTKLPDGFGNFLNPLVVADAVCYGEYYSYPSI